MGPKKKAGIFFVKSRSWCRRRRIEGWVSVKQSQSPAITDHMVAGESRPFKDIIETDAGRNCKTGPGV
jgi:hypothetical protein